MNTPELSEDQIDALTEFMNIASGKVTAAMGELLNTTGVMHIPSITFCTLNELYDMVEGSSDLERIQYVSKQLFYGVLGGESLFVLSEESAQQLNKRFYSLEDPDEDDMIDMAGEFSNIIGSTMLSKLSDELGTKISFSAPVTKKMKTNTIRLENANLPYNRVIIISTRLEFAENNIDGFIYLLAEDEMIENLKKLIDKRLEELYS